MQGHPCPATTQSCRRAAPAPWCPPAPCALRHGWRVQAAARGPVLQRAAFCPPPHATATSHTARHQPHPLCPCPCSSFGMLPPALGQWVQATAAPETQFQLLRVWGGKKVLLHLSKEHFWMPEGAVCALAVCHSCKVTLSPAGQWSVSLPQERGAWPLLPAPQPLL